MNKLLLGLCVVVALAAATNSYEEQQTNRGWGSINKRIASAAKRATMNARRASKSVKKLPRGYGLRKNRKQLKKAVGKARKPSKNCGFGKALGRKRGLVENGWGRFKFKKIVVNVKKIKQKKAAQRAAKKARARAAFKKHRARVLALSKKNKKLAVQLARRFRAMHKARKQAYLARQAQRRACRLKFWRRLAAKAKAKKSRKNRKIAKAQRKKAARALYRSVRKIRKYRWGRKSFKGFRRWGRRLKKSKGNKVKKSGKKGKKSGKKGKKSRKSRRRRTSVVRIRGRAYACRRNKGKLCCRPLARRRRTRRRIRFGRRFRRRRIRFGRRFRFGL